MVRAHEWAGSRRLVRSRRPWWVARPAPAAPPVRLSVGSTGAVVVVLVSGDVGALTDQQLESFAAEHPLVDCVVLELDLAEVTSLGSAGVSVLLGVRRWCERRGIELRLRGAAPSVERVLQAAGLGNVATAVATVFLERPPAQELALF